MAYSKMCRMPSGSTAGLPAASAVTGTSKKMSLSGRINSGLSPASLAASNPVRRLFRVDGLRSHVISSRTGRSHVQASQNESLELVGLERYRIGHQTAGRHNAASMTIAKQPVPATSGKLLESPAWDARQERLIFVDTDGQKVHSYDPHAADDASTSLITVDLPEPVGFVGLTERPKLVVAGMERRVVLVDLEKQAIISDVAITPEEHGADGHRFNDGKPGPAGVGIFGRKHESSEAPDGQRGRVYRFDLGPDPTTGKLTEIMTPEETQLPNGMDWDMKKGVMYLNDTFMEEFGDTPGIIWEMKVDQQGVPVRDASGKLDRRVVFKIDVEKEGGPDGMTLDSEGLLWLALAKGGKVICVDPGSGQEVHRIDMPIQMPTACTFGGKNLDELYITSTELGGGKGAGGLWRFKRDGLKGLNPAHAATVQSA